MFKHHNMNTYGEVDEKLHTFFTSILGGNEEVSFTPQWFFHEQNPQAGWAQKPVWIQ
jgi:hypothetical protein